jgi:NADPH:quinone reductase-like Zn-dependent oxidoreductase/acyl carrier protein
VARGEPGPGEVAIEVKAASVNFRDMMWAMGLLPEEAMLDGFAGSNLGLECAGVVTALGRGVAGISVGDRVAALGPACLGTKLIAAAQAVIRLPDNVDFASAATIPVAYLTAVYALGRLARLAEGERVLIHGGAGGVGLAAIAYAKHVGAVVFATAGSEVKRQFLKELGVDHILQSRDLSFAEEIRGLTGGEGVDVVLNSLGGEAMERSLGLLRPFGRFLELSKRDFYLNTRVGLRPLRQNISYYAIDVDRLPVERPELAAELLREVMALLENEALHALPHRTYPFAEATEAFRLMQSAGHIGKIVLVPDPPPVQPKVARRFDVRPDGTYLVTGGLSGFGLEAARWLARRGARHLALLGRRGPKTPGAVEALTALAAAGVEAKAYACDVSDHATLLRTLAEIRRTLPPLRGVVHAAMVVADGFLRDATQERIESVLTPKLAGALNLDRLTRSDPVEIFVLFSSATTVLGAPGQGSYVAANLGLEALARGRAAEGLPALAIAWGPIADAGYLAGDEKMREGLARRLAATPLPAAQALDALPELWGSGLPVVAFASVQWQAARRLPILSGPSFADFAVEDTASDISLGELIAERSPEEAKQLIAELLAREIANIMAIAPDRIDHHRPLTDLGMDSLMAVELRLALESRLGLTMPLLSMAEGVSLASLAARILATATGKGSQDQDIAAAALRHEPGALPETLPLPANEVEPGPEESGREAAAT